MPNPFVWYDLMTPDLPAAEAFYTSVAGWTAADAGFADRSYALLSVNGPAGPAMVAGLMGAPEAMKGAPSFWNGHIGVENVDLMAERVVAEGGKVYRAPEDIPHGIGRFSVVADPGGAVFILFQPGSPFQTPPPPPPPGTPGFIAWHELQAADAEAAWEFYSGLFGWTKVNDIEMGPAGTYRIFSAGGAPIGGIMTKLPELPAPSWIYSIGVDSATAAADRITAGGGKVIDGPRQVPGGGWVATAIDPHGAFFKVISGTK